MHTPADCKGVNYKKGSNDNGNNGNNNGNNNTNSGNQPQALVTLSLPTNGNKTMIKPEGVSVKVNEAYHTLVQYCDDCDDEDCY
jgi:hypothetical protein